MAADAQFVFVLEYVSNIESAHRFLVDDMGLEIERAAPTFVQLRDGNGVGFAISNEATIGGKGGQEIYWRVDNAADAYAKLSSNAEVIVPLEKKPFGTVFGIEDPAGQPHFFVEFAQNRPSQPAG